MAVSVGARTSAPEKRDISRNVGPSARRFRPDIQGLRAIAVSLVVLYHAGLPLISGGYVGVDVFFVISGFLITQHLDREVAISGRISLVRFYGRRARRLLPSAALVVVATLVFARLVMPYSQLASLTRDAIYSSFYGLNWHLAIEGVDYQNASAPPSALQHFWSLAVEEQFYVVWPLLIILTTALAPRRWKRAVMSVAICALTASSLYLSVTTTSTDGPFAYFGLHTRAWELGVGALTALALPRLLRLSDLACRALGFAGVVAVVGSAFVFTEATPFPGSAALVPVLGAAAVIVAGGRLVDRSAESRLLSHGVMQHIGKTSYAWYLWHWPMLILLPMWVGRDLNLPERLEVVVLAYWFAVLTYFLENASARSLWSTARWVVSGLGLSVVMATVAALIATFLPSVQGQGDAVFASELTSGDLDVVQAAVVEGLTVKAVPSNLTPSLADAPEDSPFEGSADCFADLPVTESPQCTYGAKNGKRVAVLVGDSHADQWLNALGTQAEANDWKIIQLTKAACPVTRIPIDNDVLGRAYTECATFQENRAQQVAKIRPDLVIASQADPIGLTNGIAADEWATTTREELEELAGDTAQVVYLGDSSLSNDDPVVCLQKSLDNAQACITPRFNGEGMRSYYEALGSEMNDNKIRYVPTLDLMCTEDLCPPIVEGMLTHRDPGHITRTYAQWLTTMFAPIFTTETS